MEHPSGAARLADHPRNIDDRIPAVQRSAPAPPLPRLRGRMVMRFAEPGGEDLRRIHAWMREEHIAPYWCQAWPLEQWRAHLERMYAHGYERPYIVEFGGKPSAYIELYRSARDVVAEHYEADPYDIGLHGAIGDRELVGKNLAFLFWLDVIPAIFTADPNCQAVITDPAADHPVAVRLDQAVADRIGGERLGEVRLPHKRAVVFRFTRAGAVRSGRLQGP